MIGLGQLVVDFAAAMEAADRRCPQAANMRTKAPFQRGIGPHSESQTVSLVGAELELLVPASYAGLVRYGVAYPEAPRQKCDLCLAGGKGLEWAVEVKMLRILGDNGKANDNILMHILSPYPAHRSALTDCDKLAQTALAQRRAILIYGYDAREWPLEPAIGAFEALGRSRVELGPRQTAKFANLTHPVHSAGAVFAWELLNRLPTVSHVGEPENRWPSTRSSAGVGSVRIRLRSPSALGM